MTVRYLYMYIYTEPHQLPRKLTRPVASQVSPALGMKRFSGIPHEIKVHIWTLHINYLIYVNIPKMAGCVWRNIRWLPNTYISAKIVSEYRDSK